ncbi:MAG: pantetheine-phosphate adenylyltransferase [SAR202 cluster bacterium]|uniref:Phosphopantetheine adenylyltransferase n=2 Tax=ecological metagenomes TaxID=410657 RepID=A0A160VBU5_9ZZZZ|nr:pantetheine-phosphate adenylyltransferase [Dehalococcoidia bacterium]MEC9237137.1 pantetheine-phosphate adenylyltransferase [Chloroflexota bacterium]MQF92176.1 pantetheine-phosphate adenylyltransferase [SAR202 cluster bacterium]MCL0053530.1 pantetheine-phosphate adenylyltransferase [Dehalococcoidia bacterium]MEC9289641.1 pantetheine-phosphate adenylyltransferase [Chloroflexota bacterium]|tara:strand:- start:293 stop:787 length:495 start_codon:yes stop_codon:yes gene_type:complete
MVTALYPGSFDPVTVGHVDIASRAAIQFEKLVVAVYDTPSKNLLFTTDEREQLMKDACSHISNVEVVRFSGLVVRFAKDIGAGAIVRGLRSGSDFEYEFDMAFMNRKLEPEVDLVCFMTSQDYMFVSASLLKEVARLGGDIKDMVPPNVAEAVYSKFGLPVRDG